MVVAVGVVLVLVRGVVGNPLVAVVGRSRLQVVVEGHCCTECASLVVPNTNAVATSGKLAHPLDGYHNETQNDPQPHTGNNTHTAADPSETLSPHH